MIDTKWFQHPGVYFIVDGAFGSTGKGAAAAWLYENSSEKPNIYTTNCSPNAGHTFMQSGLKFVTRHLSVGGVIDFIEGGTAITYLNAGAIIDVDILQDEMDQFKGIDRYVKWSKHATKILPRHKENHSSLAAIASTQKGTGPAMADRLLRMTDVVMGHGNDLPGGLDFISDIIQCEVPQGFSLGLHSGFFPYTTNRECTVMQAASDMGCPYNAVQKVMMTIRTFPIRVGNTADGFSGPHYDDQTEIAWSTLGVEPEMTTVTKRVRRVFTFSKKQFEAALRANQPHALWIGFMDYLAPSYEQIFIDMIIDMHNSYVAHPLELLVLNYGPAPKDAKVYEF